MPGLHNYWVAVGVMVGFCQGGGIDLSKEEAILRDGVAVGYGSSGGYSDRVGQSMVMGYVSKECATPEPQLAAEILVEMWGGDGSRRLGL